MSNHLDSLAVSAVRALSMDAVEAANSGHPGAPMGLAPLGVRLFTRWLRHDPADPAWPDRDRFVLSAGHASLLLYSLLHLTGYDLSIEDLRGFRQLGSRTPGHPEFGDTPGVETTTGPLGQGLGNAVGMALAERLLAARFTTAEHDVIGHRTVVIASDGDLMEGVASEAASLAGHLGLERLCVFWDDNRITIDGDTGLAFSTEDVLGRFVSYGWRTLEIEDGEDLDLLDERIGEAFEGDGRPTLVRVRTVIGYPAPTKAGTSASHGAPLGADEVRAAKAAMGWQHAPFTVPEELYTHLDQRPRGGEAHRAWQAGLDAYVAADPARAAELARLWERRLPEGWADALPAFDVGEKLATRKASATVLNALAEVLPELVGGSADLAGSNLTTITDAGDVGPKEYAGRNVHYGVREHAMGSVMNGLSLHGLRPFGGTFLTFSDYLRPTLRLAALMGQPVIHVFTHDSIGLGEDGPTHQPIEHLAALRAIPGLQVLRPADATETAGAWAVAISRDDGPSALALSRQGVPTLAGTDATLTATYGGYRVVDVDEPDVLLVATGSEVSLAVDAANRLEEEGIRAAVVSLPCWELFAAQSAEYRDAVLPAQVPTLSIEAATAFGWARWADRHVALESFGASGPAGEVFAHFGFTVEHVANEVRALLEGQRL